MINPFILKKVAALVLSACLSTVATVMGFMYFGMWGGIGLFILGILISLWIGSMMLKNPFSDMLEGKGVLAMDIPSTGVIRPFIVGIANPFLKGKLGNEEVKDVFDRGTVYQMAVPVKAKYNGIQVVNREEGGIQLDLTEEDYNNARFALYHYPVIIYNSMIKSIVTKDFIAAKENGSMIIHILLQTNRSLQELTGLIRDFARYIVEQMKPGFQLSGKWIMIIVIAIAVIIIIVLFGPNIMQAISKPVATGIGAVTGGATITPVG